MQHDAFSYCRPRRYAAHRCNVSSSDLYKAQRNRVHAIAQAGRFRTVVEHVPEVGVAARAGYGRSLHTPGAVSAGDNILFGNRFPKTGPTSAGFELGFRTKQRRVTANATEQPLAVQIQVLAAVGPLGPVFAGDLIRRL